MTDIKETTEGDVWFENGDLSYTESSEQHERNLLLSDKGHYKRSPDIGVGAINFVNDTTTDELLLQVRREFTKDGMKVRKVIYRQGELTTDAIYETDSN